MAVGPLVVLAGVALADDSLLTLESSASYRGFFAQTEWENRVEHLTEERLYAAVDSFLVERAFVAYNVGFGLDHSMRWNPLGRTDTLGYQYDGRVDFWEKGVVPVGLFANRERLGAAQTAAPGSQVTTEISGYDVAIRPVHLPKIHSRGYLQRRRAESELLGLDERRTASVDGQLNHSDNHLLAVGEVRYRRDVEPADLEDRQIAESRLYTDYKLDDHLSFTARGRVQSYASSFAGTDFDLDTLLSDATLRWRPSREFQGTTFTRVSRSSQGPGNLTSDVTFGTGANWEATPSFSLVSSLGGNTTLLEDAGSTDRFIGEYVNTRGTLHENWSSTGVQLDTQLGAAGMTEVDVGTGAQAGAASRLSVFQRIPETSWLLTGGGEGGRQWDTSPRDLDYWTAGWSVGAASRRVGGPNVLMQLDHHVITQLSIEEGNSDRLRGSASVAWQPTTPLTVSYGLTGHRDVLDDQFSRGLGNSVRAGLVSAPTFRTDLVYQYTVVETFALPSMWTHRLDLVIAQQFRLFQLSARTSLVSVGGRVPRSDNQLVWLEVKQAFRWRL